MRSWRCLSHVTVLSECLYFCIQIKNQISKNKENKVNYSQCPTVTFYFTFLSHTEHCIETPFITCCWPIYGRLFRIFLTCLSIKLYELFENNFHGKAVTRSGKNQLKNGSRSFLNE